MAVVPKNLRNVRVPRVMKGNAISGRESINRQRNFEFQRKTADHAEALKINEKVNIQQALNKKNGTTAKNTSIADTLIKSPKKKGDYTFWNGNKYVSHDGTSDKYMKNIISTKPKSSSDVNKGEGLSMLRDYQKASQHVPNADPDKMMNTKMLKHDMGANFHGAGGWGEVGKTAIRGAAVGGLAGGSLEAMQGGDFWDGAKTGAFIGGTGMAGMKIAKQSTGARKYLGDDGILQTYGTMKEEYGVGVKALLTNQKHVKNATNWVTGNTKNAKKKQG